MRFGLVFFFNDTATTEIYTLSLHDALPISGVQSGSVRSALSVAVHQFFLDRTLAHSKRDRVWLGQHYRPSGAHVFVLRPDSKFSDSNSLADCPRNRRRSE